MFYFLIPYISHHSCGAAEGAWLAPAWLEVLVIVLVTISCFIAVIIAVVMTVLELREWKEEHQKPKEK